MDAYKTGMIVKGVLGDGVQKIPASLQEMDGCNLG